MHNPGMLSFPGMLDNSEVIGRTCPRDPQVSWDARSQGDDGMHNSGMLRSPGMLDNSEVIGAHVPGICRSPGMQITGRCYGGYRPD